jgi:predicted RNA methylase
MFTAYDIQACLFDRRRVEYLRDAIQRTVRGGDVVVDAGSGTGLLGMFAAQAGAAKVYCIELNGDFIPVIEENARRNGLSDRIVPVHADATKALDHILPNPVDMVISEVISAGFFYEPQLQIMSNLRKFLKPGGAIVPNAMRNYVELIEAQETLYDLTFNFDSRFTDLAGDRPLTSRTLYLATNFHGVTDPVISEIAPVRATSRGTANAAKITYEIQFVDNGEWIDTPTEFLLNPQIIFLPSPVDVDVDHVYKVSLSYRASESPRTCNIVISD